MPPGGKILNHPGQIMIVLDLLNNFAQDANFLRGQVQEGYFLNKSFMHTSAASKKNFKSTSSNDDSPWPS